MIRTLLLFIAASLPQSCLAAVTFDWAIVRNPANAADPQTGLGRVLTNYSIAKTEVTNAQYVEFLNAVAATDPHGLYNPSMGFESLGGITRDGASGSYTYAVKSPAAGQGPARSDYAYGDKPVNFVSFFDAMRFTNWLHNGQGSADTETGAYTIGNGVNEVRSTNARYWIPSLDEWYKAAYHDATAGRTGRYYDFPTTSNVAPNNNLPAADTGNSANYSPGGLTTGNRDYPLLDVGSYGRSDSPYGTFDQGGNVGEWVEAVTSPSARGLRGGSYVMNSNPMLAEFATLSVSPFAEYRDTGFRIAVPEPTSLALAAMLTGCGMTRRRRIA